MYKNKKILAVIPARGGSKGIKNKNIIPLGGKPLIFYTVDQAIKSNLIDKIIISSDSDKILNTVGNTYKNLTLEKRPQDLAKDESKISDTLKFIINNSKEQYDIVVLLQPTSPFRTLNTINQAIINFCSNYNLYSSLMPVTETSPKIGYIENKKYNQINKGEFQRQEMKKLYKECGVIFIYKSENIKQNNIIGDNIYPFIINNRKENIDIDTLEDLQVAELFLTINY